MFHHKKPPTQIVTNGRFEFEQEGQVAWLEYTLAGEILQLIHTEVPAALRGKGVAATLAHSALEWARENHVKVDVVCDSVLNYLKDHPEYADLVVR